jgi:glycosyltransferase involved in cell wall biosynthesis
VARLVLRQVDHAIAGNREAVELLRGQGFVEPISTLPQLGVDVGTFRPRDARALRRTLGLDGFVVGFVGRLRWEKGVDLLLRAAARIGAVRVLLVGGGAYRAELESLARSLELRDRVVIVDSVPHHEVPDYLSAMDVLVLPSRSTPRWKEQFGHVLIEAMACGTPVIGSDSGAIPETLGEAGLVFPEGDAKALADRIRLLGANPRERERLRDHGRERVGASFTHDQVARETARIYRAVLQGPRSRG